MKDLVVKHKGNKARFRFLEWDTNFFGVKSYMLDTPSLVVTEKKREFANIVSNSLGRSFVVAKVPSFRARRLIDFLLGLDFKYITTEIVLRFNKTGILNDKVSYKGLSNVVIEKAKRLPRDAYLLGREFSLTRFHLDSKISKRMSDGVWTSYIRNYRLDKNHHVFLARAGSRTIGSIFVNQCLKDDKKVSNLFVVAVRKKYRLRNIGSLLLKFALKWCMRHSDAITVGTQSDNLSALNFYIKNGFSKKDQTKMILHRWGKAYGR